MTTTAERGTCVARKPGLVGHKIDGCRCQECHQANLDYENMRRRKLAYGQWQPFVSAQPVRDHIVALRAAGAGTRRIAHLAGVSLPTINSIVWGSKRRGLRQKIRTETAEAILAVQTDVTSVSPLGMVDATGTRRRIEALGALGWSLAHLARELGCRQETIRPVAMRARVRKETAAAVGALYDRMLWVVPPANQVTTRCRNYAKAQGWAPPLAWDDIDDPGDKPSVYPRGERCSNGHEYDDGNRFRDWQTGRTRCRACKNEARERSRKRARNQTTNAPTGASIERSAA